MNGPFCIVWETMVRNRLSVTRLNKKIKIRSDYYLDGRIPWHLRAKNPHNFQKHWWNILHIVPRNHHGGFRESWLKRSIAFFWLQLSTWIISCNPDFQGLRGKFWPHSYTQNTIDSSLSMRVFQINFCACSYKPVGHNASEPGLSGRKMPSCSLIYFP